MKPSKIDIKSYTFHFFDNHITKEFEVSVNLSVRHLNIKGLEILKFKFPIEFRDDEVSRNIFIYDMDIKYKEVILESISNEMDIHVDYLEPKYGVDISYDNYQKESVFRYLKKIDLKLSEKEYDIFKEKNINIHRKIMINDLV